MKPEVMFIVGPTAVGKTETAVHLAKKINAEIISCDSMQVYRGMDILTSKPQKSLKKQVRHHLISEVSVQKEYSVSMYHKDVLKKIKEITKRAKPVLLVGGSGLYMSVILDGIFKMKPALKNLRERLYKTAQDLGNVYLYNRLKEIDIAAAENIHPHDTKRIVRALEVFETTGKPISYLQKQRVGISDKYDVKIFCLNLPRDTLYRRIEERIDKMFEQGLIQEVKRLLRKKLSKTASYAIGLREVKGYLEGQYGLDEAKRLIKRNTRRFARRQLSWFRREKRIEWIQVGAKEKSVAVARRILQKLANPKLKRF